MPILAGTSLVINSIKNALSLKEGAEISTTAQLIALGVAQIVSMGLFPVTPTPPFPLPLVPSGLSAGQNLIKQALSMREGADINTTAQLIAQGISMIAPVAPVSGLSALTNSIRTALTLKEGADIITTANLIGIAIPMYYMSGGVL